MLRPGRVSEGPGPVQGFTLLELLMVLVIIATLTGMALPRFQEVRERAQVARAIGDIRALSIDLMDHELGEGVLPASLADIGRDQLLDPWGNPYQYQRIRGPGKVSVGQLRKDRFLVPLNSDFDLYSMGPDGRSQTPLTAQASRDDIVRANDGGFVGVAETY